MAEFSTSIIEKEGVSIIYLTGYLDAHTAPALEDNFTELIDKNKFRIESISVLHSIILSIIYDFGESLEGMHL